MDILIIGDTRCGKSAIVEGIVSGIHLGDFIKCENTSFAGLVGGLQQLGSRAKWDIVWGKIPLNNGKLLAADEMSSLDLSDIGNMSAVRSSGIAEVVKVQAGITRAATRLIWISNPRSERNMSSYSYGVQAVQELVGRPEDIARFDFAIGVRSDDVHIDIINSNARTKEQWAPKWEELRTLVRWVWQLRPQDVLIDEKTTNAILDVAKGQSKDYHCGIPLVEPNEQRIRIARVAVAVAARSFSEQGGKLIVNSKHVEYADHFMRECFNSQALGYRHYSSAMQRTEGENELAKAEVIKILHKYSDSSRRCIKLVMQIDQFTTTDIETFFNVPRAEARELLSVMMQYGCVVRKYSNFHKTPLGIRVIEEALRV